MSYFIHIYKIISLIMLYGFLLFNYSDIYFAANIFFPFFNLLYFFFLQFHRWFPGTIPSQHRAFMLAVLWSLLFFVVLLVLHFPVQYISQGF